MALLTAEQRKIARASNGMPTVWMGRPVQGMYLRAGDLPMLLFGGFTVLFGVFFFGLSIFTASRPPDGWFGPIFVIFWLTAVLSQTIAPVLFAAMARSRTSYALTDDGYALLVTDFFGFHAKRVYLPAVANVELDLRADGTGTITFGTPPSGMGSWFRGWGSAPRPPCFERIADAALVYHLCSQLQQGKKL